MQLQLRRRVRLGLSLRLLFLLSTFLALLIISAATVVEIANLRAVKQLLLQRLVDLVMHVTGPSGGGRSRRHLRRELR